MPRRRQRRSRTPLIALSAAIIIIAAGGFVAYQGLQPTLSFPLPCLPNESLFVHIHPWVRILVNEENVSIPAGVGISNPIFQGTLAVSGTCFEPIHTHDASGIIHIEAPANTTYTLGDFFKVWKASFSTVTVDGQKHPIVFNSTDILGFTADAHHKVLLLVDGSPSTSYEGLPLNGLDYCSKASSGPPCSPTAVGSPLYGAAPYPFGTGHTIVIEYVSAGQ